MVKLHRKNDTYIVTDSCYWHDHEKDEEGRSTHEIEVVNIRTGGIRNIKSGSHIKIVKDRK